MSESALKTKKSRKKSEAVDEVSLVNRLEARDQLQTDVEAFLSRGGQVTQVDDNVRADPPRKPSMNYGSAPI